MIRTIEMPILHREIAEFLDPRIHEAAPGTPSFALHGFRIDDREYVMDCLPTVGLMVGYRIVETGELVSALQCDKGVPEEKQLFRALLSAACGKYLATKNCVSSLPDGSYGEIECFYICGEELVCNDAGEMPSLCPNCGVMVEYPTPCIEMEGV